MLPTRFCAVTVATTLLAIGCNWAEDVGSSVVRDDTGMVRVNEENDYGRFYSRQLLSSRPMDGLHTRYTSDNAITPSKVDIRIAGGRPAQIVEFPYLASLKRYWTHFCTACIVTNSWLLTAGHCVVNYSHPALPGDPKEFSVVAGTNILTDNETMLCDKDQVTRQVVQLVLHPDFDGLGFQHNLALLRMDHSLSFRPQIFNARLRDTPLSHHRQLPTGRRCFVTGWGSSGPRKRKPGLKEYEGRAQCTLGPKTYSLQVLQTVTVPLLSVLSCLRLYPWMKDRMNESYNICSLSLEKKDACRGDSGGPLTCGGYVIGVVSWGKDCANITSPTVYTRADAHADWIKRVTHLRSSDRGSRLSVPVALTLCLPMAALAGI